MSCTPDSTCVSALPEFFVNQDFQYLQKSTLFYSYNEYFIFPNYTYCGAISTDFNYFLIKIII